MPPGARITDLHTFPMQTPGTPPIPHVGGPIVAPGCPTVLLSSDGGGLGRQHGPRRHDRGGGADGDDRGGEGRQRGPESPQHA